MKRDEAQGGRALGRVKFLWSEDAGRKGRGVIRRRACGVIQRQERWRGWDKVEEVRRHTDLKEAAGTP
jgi:hypothetical protein